MANYENVELLASMQHFDWQIYNFLIKASVQTIAIAIMSSTFQNRFLMAYLLQVSCHVIPKASKWKVLHPHYFISHGIEWENMNLMWCV